MAVAMPVLLAVMAVEADAPPAPPGRHVVKDTCGGDPLSTSQPVAFCVEGFACWQSRALYVVTVHPAPPGLQAPNTLAGGGLGCRRMAGAKFTQRPVSYTKFEMGTLPLGMGQDVTSEP